MFAVLRDSIELLRSFVESGTFLRHGVCVLMQLQHPFVHHMHLVSGFANALAPLSLLWEPIKLDLVFRLPWCYPAMRNRRCLSLTTVFTRTEMCRQTISLAPVLPIAALGLIPQVMSALLE